MRVAVIAYDRISPFMLSTPLAVFGEPFLAAGHRVDVCAAEPRVAAGAGAMRTQVLEVQRSGLAWSVLDRLPAADGP